jgi:hypothetical protein
MKVLQILLRNQDTVSLNRRVREVRQVQQAALIRCRGIVASCGLHYFDS